MTERKKLVLASGSPRRHQIMEQMGYEFLVVTPDVDESKHLESDPRDLVEQLAREKAREVASRLEGVVVVAADTVVADGDQILGKPEDSQHAFAMLASLRGRTHQVHTGVAVMESPDGTVHSFVESTDVTMKDYADILIQWYVATGSPLDKAGGYGIQEKGGLLVKGICGDYYNVVGLPVGRLYDLLDAQFHIHPLSES